MMSSPVADPGGSEKEVGVESSRNVVLETSKESFINDRGRPEVGVPMHEDVLENVDIGMNAGVYKERGLDESSNDDVAGLGSEVDGIRSAIIHNMEGNLFENLVKGGGLDAFNMGGNKADKRNRGTPPLRRAHINKTGNKSKAHSLAHSVVSGDQGEPINK
ncbi:hypothetical protein Hanom_Chr17g01585871 [Helianthus anomalus]